MSDGKLTSIWFFTSGAALDVLVGSIGGQNSGDDISPFLLCSLLAGLLRKSVYAVEMLIWYIYSIYTNENFLILVQIQHESNFCEDSTGRRADPGLTPT